MSTVYLQTLRTSLPEELVAQVDELCKSPSAADLLETLIRFTIGGEPSTETSVKTRQEWSLKQLEAKEALDKLTLPSDHKRAREEDTTQLWSTVKRPKLLEV